MVFIIILSSNIGQLRIIEFPTSIIHKLSVPYNVQLKMILGNNDFSYEALKIQNFR